ncbi:C6 domain protein [Necator americanus]|uniref:C6 domain protein n=1 Tax=Necator americanus TaxID=51031 RepID=W2TWA6_NECAM|nr:C6 domain protein [Necator americanus]ETN85341.1 C6 domain protein [Necator americanus]
MIVLFLVLLLPFVKPMPCNTEGEWGPWSEWTTCPQGSSAMMNFRTRIRTCEPRPTGCVVEGLYSCRGTYSEVTDCDLKPPVAPFPLTITSDITDHTEESPAVDADGTTEIPHSSVMATGYVTTAAAQQESTARISTASTDPMNEDTTGTTETDMRTQTTVVMNEDTTETAETDLRTKTTFEPIETSAASEFSTTRLPEPEPDSSGTTVIDSDSLGTTATCDDCPELNVRLFGDKPYEDGASVLNRYSEEGCKFVQFFCRPFEQIDERPVQTVFNNNLTFTDLPLNVQISCKNGRWYDELLNIAVESLSCIYRPSDLNRSCVKCKRELCATPMKGQEGSTYMDFHIDQCLSVDVFCQPIKGNLYVDLLEDYKSVEITGTTVNHTFTCTDNMEWMDTISQQIVGNVTCLMRDG